MQRESSIVIILNEKREVLLLLRPTWINWGAGQWAFPGGKLEAGENPKEAAIRETKEETQLDVRALQEVEINVDKKLSIYYTTQYDGEVVIDWEHDDWAWVGVDNLSEFSLAPDVRRLYEWVLNYDR